MTVIKLKIADVIIELRSQFRMKPLDGTYDWPYKKFIHRTKKNPGIILHIKIMANPPLFYRSERIFATIHPISGETNWSLFKKEEGYILVQHVSKKTQWAILNKGFSKGTVYIPPDKKNASWKLEDMIHNFLQIILINYLSRREGIFVHSVGLKDVDKRGLLFAGPTRSGKSTTARLWHDHSRAKILNDDRIVIRKAQDKFYIFSTPWHGDFNEYFKSSPDKAELKNIFFIYQSPENKIKRLRPKEAYRYLYPNIFPAFWNKESLARQMNLCWDLVSFIASCRLGFKKDKSVISIVRSSRYKRFSHR